MTTAAESWDDEQHSRAESWRSDISDDNYPGTEPTPKTPRASWDENGNCTREGCGHPKAEHGLYGCRHVRDPRFSHVCMCVVGGER